MVGYPEVIQIATWGSVPTSRLVGSDLRTCHRFWSDYGLLGSNVHAWIGRNAETELLPNTEAIVGASAPGIKKMRRSARDRLGELGLTWGNAVLEESAGGEELGVEQGGAGGAADEVVGEQR